MCTIIFSLKSRTCLLDRNTKTLQDLLCRNGSDIRGYFQWSFMDMFEFINPNYTYGLYNVNFSDPKRERSPKTSALWYSALLKGKTVSLQKLKNRSMSSSPGVSCQ